MRRREYLAALTPLPLAGCLGDGSSMVTDQSETESRSGTAGEATPTANATATDDSATARGADAPGEVLDLGETAETDGPVDVTVESVAVQRSVIDAHTWRELREPSDGQVLVAETAVGHGDLSFGLRLDGERVAVENLALAGGSRRQALAVPLRSAERGLLVLDQGERPAWSLPDDVLDQLGSAAEFRLRDVTVREGEGDRRETSESASGSPSEARDPGDASGEERPASSKGDGGTELVLTVENSGDRDGTFRGIVVSAVASDADAAVRFPVPAGETVTEVVRNDVVGNWEPDADFVHDVGPDTRRFVVKYV
ncbi:hypothetical protein [Halomicrobium salinisoli]|uniref:hypothetical protein n=1 Tax=Halomicrobium salinisoli TaxID=2878391 RepID=UPI001CEFC32D|nr:hypothetical protein [Halomicrobium salinisoli]